MASCAITHHSFGGESDQLTRESESGVSGMAWQA